MILCKLYRDGVKVCLMERKNLKEMQIYNLTQHKSTMALCLNIEMQQAIINSLKNTNFVEHSNEIQ